MDLLSLGHTGCSPLSLPGLPVIKDKQNYQNQAFKLTELTVGEASEEMRLVHYRNV